MIVVDASVLASALGDDGPDGHHARRELRGPEDIAIPDLADVETVSVWRKRWLAGDLGTRRFRAAIDDLTDFAATRYPVLPLMARAYELRANVTPYDAVYVALAEELGCSLLTLDARLARAPGPRCPIHIPGGGVP